MVKNFTGKEDMILDGVCRRLEEAVALDSLFDFYKIEKPEHYFNECFKKHGLIQE